MFFIRDRSIKIHFLIPILIFLLSCESMAPGKHPKSSSKQWIGKYRGPITVAVLPFTNETQEKDIEDLVRRSFYNNFSSKNYYDVELGEVDQILKSYKKDSPKAWRSLSPSSLGQLLQADLIIYGKVRDFNKYYVGIYSQICLELDVEMVQCRNGRVVWAKRVIERSHDGGIPFTFLDIIPAAIRSGVYLNQEGTLHLIDRLNRELVAQIPEPPCTSLSGSQIDVQVASFLEEGLAFKTLEELKEKDLSARIEKVSLKGGLWHRVLIGPFFHVSEAREVKKKVLQYSRFQPIFIRHIPNPKTNKGSMKGVSK